jgi:hypothetical protein
MAELVARPPTEPKVRVLNHHPDKHFLPIKKEIGAVI